MATVCPDTPPGESPRINLLVLLDTSGSLKTNDPSNLRSAGTRDALQVLDGLSSEFSGVQIEVTVDTFDRRYFRQQGWLPASGIYDRIGDAIGDIASDDGSYTDYVEALAGAWSRFAARADDCNLLIWFTDGEHATASDAEGERRELVQLCSSPQMQSLRDHVWVGAVQLNTGDLQGSQLRFLYGEDDPAADALECANPLRGRVYDDFDPAGLRLVLKDLIATSIAEGDSTEERPLPPVRRPSPSDFEQCAGGDGSRERPCVVAFDLDAGIESFRAFVDLTFVERGITNPESVLMAVRSPDGATSPSIGGSGDIRPGESSGSYLPVDPFSFYARSLYPSDLQIVGHQVAEHLVDSIQWQWQWEGSWQLRFFGDTPEAQADARKAAAVVRFQTTDRPAVDSFGLDHQCTLSGFILNYPQQEYENVEFRVRVDAADGQPVYATRPSLTEEPLEVADGNRRFELPDLLDRLIAWDTPQRGGNGRNLREAIQGRGGLALVAVLSQRFQYAGLSENLTWERDIGQMDLPEGHLVQLSRLLDGHGIDHLLCLPMDPSVRWLPTDMSLGDSRHGWDEATFAVTAVPGELPATLSLEVELAGIVESPGTEQADATSSAIRLAASPWTCDVPAAAGGEGRFTCPEPISVLIDSETPLLPDLPLRLPLRVAEQPGSASALLARLGHSPDSGDYQLRASALADALGRERRLEDLDTSIPANIDPTTHWLSADLELNRLRPADGEYTGEEIDHDVSSVDVDVDADPGILPTTLRLDRLAVLSGSEETLSDGTGWTCDVPAAASEDGRFTCPEPITVDLPSEREAELDLTTRLCVADQPGSADALLERLGYEPGSGDYEPLRGLIAEAMDAERGCFTQTTKEPVQGDKLSEFWPMLAVLVAVALAARVFVAWRLRPWHPIDSPDFVTVPLDAEDGPERSLTFAGTRRDICMDLTQRKASTAVGGAELRSAWLPLLLGRSPRLRASSSAGDCIGPRGYAQSRDGRCRADIGADLAGGWVVEAAAGEARLIVWDLPEDSRDAEIRLEDAVREATARLTTYRESRGATLPEQEDTAAGEGAPAPREDAADPSSGPDDPFADNDSDESDHDPFGRTN